MLVLAGLGLSVTGYGLSIVADRTQEAAALQNAMVLSRSVGAFRSLYTEEIVSELEEHGLGVSHRAIGEEGGFPLPKNLSLRFANVVGSDHLSSVARLYSPFPFPWVADGGIRDEFGARAWAELSVDPTTPVKEFEERDGRLFLRYATADILDEACVQCHNTYSGTPRSDWKVGDLRGVLEVSLPVDSQVVIAGSWFPGGIYIFSLLSALFIAVATLSVFASRRTSQQAYNEAARYQRTSNELQAAIVERELAEEEARQLESQIQHAQKLESFCLMIGGLAHDFNNLLLPIVANTGFLRERTAADPMSAEMLDEVDMAASRAADICAQMLTYAGKSGETERVGLDLSTLLKETGRLLTANLEPNCSLELDLRPNLPPIKADPVQIGQIVLNLITNAAEAIGEAEGTIRLRTGEAESRAGRKTDTGHDCTPSEDGPNSWMPAGTRNSPGKRVYFEVADNGQGMDTETIEKIFDPFFSTKFTGRGLGLAAVQGIVRSHSGSIDVDSEPGSHTVIRVTFPCDSGVELSEETTAAEDFESWKASGTILLAEDEAVVQAVAKRMLEEIGFRVVCARDGQDAVWRFSREPERFVAFFSDLTMPRMNGLQAMREIRKIRADLPVILCSGYSERIDELADVADDNTLFLRKPFRSRNLRENCFALLGAQGSSKTADRPEQSSHLSQPKMIQDSHMGFAESLPSPHGGQSG